MKKKVTILFILIVIVLMFIYINYDTNKIKIDENDLSLIIPKQISNKIETELLTHSKTIVSIIENDPMNGYSIGLSTPSLTKEGIKKIYNYLKQHNICIDDAQGYYDLENKSIFEEFWKKYMNNEDCSFSLYRILQTGNIERSDYYFDDNIYYVIKSTLNLSDKKNPKVENIYGREIKNPQFDENGFFYYQIVISDIMKQFGIIEYEYIRMSSLGEKNREYTQKYIHTIDYQCTNIFTEDWDMNCIEKVNFSDLFEYLYEFKYQSPFYANEMEYSLDPFIKEIPEKYFEELIKEYFIITSNEIKKFCVYDKDKQIYPWREGYCIPSKFETPAFKGEVISIKENNEILILTVQVNGYEFGYSNGFIHKIQIKIDNNKFKFIGNKIVDSSKNNIPQYTPGITCNSLD